MSDINMTQSFTYDIKKKILSGEWAEGFNIPSLRDLSAGMGVSRSVVNTAIANLATEGYVVISPRKGTSVSDWRHEGTLAVLNDAIELGYIDNETVNGLFQILIFIECNGVLEASFKGREEDIIVLKAVTDREAATKNIDELVRLDMEYLKMIIKMSGNIAYSLIFGSLEGAIMKAASIYCADESTKQNMLKIHKNIYEALKSKDGQMAKWEMQTLLDHLRVLIEYKTGNRNDK
ncbi:MAG: GntR family transcriptional regulator [Clostridia bacterium]|jgi:DNA-binding FadR family transcriptional regulator